MKKRIIQLLTECISMESSAEHPQQKEECIQWVKSSFMAKNSHKTVIGAFKGCPYLYLKNPRSKLLLFAHLDVVPGEPGQFKLRVSGDKAFGRGTTDMKGSALPMLMAYADAYAAGEDPPVSILLTSDEEISGETIPMLLRKEILRETVAYTPDTGGNQSIVTEHKGIIWPDLVVKGTGGHGSSPWNYTNPIPILVEALKRIEKHFPAGTGDDWKLTVTPTRLWGSNAHNQIPDEARCSLDIRYTANTFKGAKEVLALVSSVLPKGCKLELRVTSGPLKTDANHPVIQLFQRVATETLRKPVPFGRVHGTSDARYFAEFGIPAFLYCPVGGGIHGSKEWISLSSMEKHYHMYRRLFGALIE